MDFCKYMELSTRLSHCQYKRKLLFKEYYDAMFSNDWIKQTEVAIKLKGLSEEVNELEKDFNDYAKELGII